MTTATLPAAKARADLVAQLRREERTTSLPSAHRYEIRGSEDGGTYTLEGYASVFENPYEIEDVFGTYTEYVARGAFAKTLQEQADVRLLLNHDGLPLARTRSGTLELSEDDTGLKVVATLDGFDPDVRSVYPKMMRGDLDEMSFAFRAIRWEWSDDYTVRRLEELKLYDVSLVTFPANPATSATLRSVDALRALALADPEKVAAELRSDSAGIGRETLASVHELIGRMLDPEPAEPKPDPLAIRRREQEHLTLAGRP